MIYMSYFGNRRLDSVKDRLVSIARFQPPKFICRTCPSFAPTLKMLDDYKEGRIDEAEYERLYTKYITENYDVHSIVNTYKLDGKILLCYEKPNEFCHRHVLAKILKNYGYKVKEILTLEDLYINDQIGE